MRSLTKGAFTLLELLVVIIVMGILASIALPGYIRTKERALAKEAISNLKLIAAAERIYKMEDPDNIYTRCSCNVSGSTAIDGCDNTTYGCNYLLKLSLSPQNWKYTVGTTVDYKYFSATARRASGNYFNCQYTLTSAVTDGEPIPNSQCP